MSKCRYCGTNVKTPIVDEHDDELCLECHNHSLLASQLDRIEQKLDELLSVRTNKPVTLADGSLFHPLQVGLKKTEGKKDIIWYESIK